MTFLRNKKNKFLLLGLITIVPIIVIGSVTLFSEKPPIEKLTFCQKAIAEARKEEANIYSPTDLHQAEKLWQEAMKAWEKNNNKSKILRDFNGISKLANRSLELAIKAKETSIEKRKKLRSEIKQNLIELKSSADYIERATNKLPLNHGIRNKLTPAKLKLEECESAYNRNDLLAAKKSLDNAKSSIEKLKKQTSEILENYFSNYTFWVKTDEEMKQWSKTNSSVSIVVDKFSRICKVYKSGKKIKEFEVELGVNWLGDKRHRGDRATPEGKYKIVAKKSGNKTIYHKALLINFPNEEDKKQFASEKAKGNIPQSYNIGGSIEIHGGGGKGIDWTEGCVALVNRDMDQLFSLCSVGTPIAIVGSLIPLNELLLKD
jgi:hypothetical protein